jgi:hypothetical protein
VLRFEAFELCEAIDVIMPVSRYSSAAGMNPLLLHLASVNQEANVSLHFHTMKNKTPRHVNQLCRQN